MEITTKDVLRVISYCSLIHHINGRLRVRVSPSIKKELNGFSKAEIESYGHEIKSAIENFSGIKNVKVNKKVASVTIEYDSEILPKSFWDDLLNGKNADEAVVKFNQLIKESA
ncbi:MAG: hypothetical protein GX282_08255 [Campylobacteraceae bacterium]|mgnify:CR=1 FL=1|nr:hypothetical protein [Campylobacteraceae bacterium]